MGDGAKTDSLPGLEAAAAIILKRAVQADTEKRFLEALTCYKEGIDLLLSVSRGEFCDFLFILMLICSLLCSLWR